MLMQISGFFFFMSVGMHLGCSCSLATVESAMQTKVQMCLGLTDLVAFGYMPSSGIAALCDSLFLMFFRGASMLFSIMANLIIF